MVFKAEVSCYLPEKICRDFFAYVNLLILAVLHVEVTDVFITPSEEVDDGVDLYIATEFADRGDLYHFKGSLSPDDVKSLMWQFLLGVNYMHSCKVWHRDIKSDNVLLTEKMHVKICDFGLARSAEETPLDDLGPHKKVLSRQYTKTVVTPNYRAPEVIMSQGQYKSAIDIWSVGCVFWELIMRNLRKGRCPPLFGVRGEPVTPEDGQSYVKDGSSVLAEQAGNLTNNLKGYVDQQAIDLLSRMLEFNPSRRCTSEEALAHAYFKNMKRPTDTRQLIAEDPVSALSTGALWKIKDPSLVLEQLELQLEIAESDMDGGRRILMILMNNEIHQQKQQDLIQQSFLSSFAAAKLQFLAPRTAIACSSALECNEGVSLPYGTANKRAGGPDPGLFTLGRRKRKQNLAVATVEAQENFCLIKDLMSLEFAIELSLISPDNVQLLHATVMTDIPLVKQFLEPVKSKAKTRNKTKDRKALRRIKVAKGRKSRRH